MTDERFKANQKLAELTGKNWWRVDRQTAIAINKKSMKMLKKLNSVKKEMLYVGYTNGRWRMPSRISNKMLEWLCKYLNYDVLRPYYMVNLDLYMESIGAKKDKPLTLEQTTAMMKSKQGEDLNGLYDVYNTAQFKKIIGHAYATIDTIASNSA